MLSVILRLRVMLRQIANFRHQGLKTLQAKLIEPSPANSLFSHFILVQPNASPETIPSEITFVKSGKLPRHNPGKAISSNEFHTMDTIKLLLAATTALLMGALLWTWNSQQKQTRDAPASELARVQKLLNDIKQEEEILRAEKQLRDLVVSNKGNLEPTTPVNNTQTELEEKAAKLREIEEKNAALQKELEIKEKEANVAKKEAGLIAQNDLEKSDKELRRARQIREALLMAKVMEYRNDPATGAFVTIQLVMAENVTVETVLAVRRKEGIAGNVKVREIIGTEAIADVLPGVGPFTPEPGDELIIAPAF